MKEQSLVSLVYFSRAAQPFSDSDLVDLLQNIRLKNTQNDVTGMLLFKDDNFLQVIEGKEKTIDMLFQKISKDPRHHQVTLLSREERAERDFGDWSMGFRNINKMSTEELAGFTTFLTDDNTTNQFTTSSSSAYKMLLEFRNFWQEE